MLRKAVDSMWVAYFSGAGYKMYKYPHFPFNEPHNLLNGKLLKNPLTKSDLQNNSAYEVVSDDQYLSHLRSFFGVHSTNGDPIKYYYSKEHYYNIRFFFEKLFVKLLVRMGYKGANVIAKQTQKSNDGGIDGIIKKDPLGIGTVYVQAKRYSSNDKVTKNEIKNFYTSVKDRNSSRGAFITTSLFNGGAKTEARLHSIILINGHDLTHFMIKYGIGVQRKRFYIVTGCE